MQMRPLSAFLTLFFVGVAVGVAQQPATDPAAAPIERQSPPGAAPVPLRAYEKWPDTAHLASGTPLLISTWDGFTTHTCVLVSFEVSGVACRGIRHDSDAFYERGAISRIQISPKHYAALGRTSKFFAQEGLIVGGIGIFCGVDGGPVCATPAIIGLSMLATAGTLKIVQFHKKHTQSVSLYMATAPPPGWTGPGSAF